MPFAECSTAKDEHPEKGDQKRQMGEGSGNVPKCESRCVSWNGPSLHSGNLGFLRRRILFGWKRAETVVWSMPRRKKGGEDSVWEMGHWLLLGLAWETWRGDGEVVGLWAATLAMALVGTALWRTVHQSGEPKLADELEESSYTQTCGISSRNNQVRLLMELEILN